jgi:hypothetical protein
MKEISKRPMGGEKLITEKSPTPVSNDNRSGGIPPQFWHIPRAPHYPTA